METNIAVLIATLAFIAGAAIGATVTFWFIPSQRKHRSLEEHLHKNQKDFNEYKHEVTDHFTKTAKLLESLAQNYRDVHNHLAQGAQELCKDSFDQRPILRKLPSLDELSGDEDLSIVSPPLDYAPKSSPYEKGMLSEGYGLDKNNTDEPSEAPVAIHHNGDELKHQA